MKRPDGRAPTKMREVTLERGPNPYAEGSCLIRAGGTVVSCTASVQEGAPQWRRGTGLGWVTAEYSMLPRSTSARIQRERRGAGGRTHEIQRLIGRSLRAALSDFAFGEYTIIVDCDVLQADGGTRTAAITGGAVALHDACRWLGNDLKVDSPFNRLVAAVSVGVVKGRICLDLSYAEDKEAEVDANVVIVEPDRFVEVQCTGEGASFSRGQLEEMLDLARDGIEQLFAEQRAVLGR